MKPLFYSYVEAPKWSVWENFRFVWKFVVFAQLRHGADGWMERSAHSLSTSAECCNEAGERVTPLIGWWTVRMRLGASLRLQAVPVPLETVQEAQNRLPRMLSLRKWLPGIAAVLLLYSAMSP